MKNRRLKLMGLILLSVMIPVCSINFASEAIGETLAIIATVAETIWNGGNARRATSSNAVWQPVSSAAGEHEATPSQATPANARMPLPLQPHETVVYDFDELKEVLQSDNGITTVYFGADITGKVGGILIPSNKSDIIIDGTWEDVTYTYTDYYSSAINNGINVRDTSVGQVTVRNLNVDARNWYGIVGVYMESRARNVTIVCENLNYDGPQMIYNPYGKAVIKDCEINILNKGLSQNELLEASSVELYGTINATHNTTTSLFWIHGSNGLFTVHEDARITITSQGTSYGLFYDAEPVIHVKRGATFDFISNDVEVTYTNCAIEQMILEENSRWSVEFKGTSLLVDPFAFNGAVRIGKNAELKVICNQPIAGYNLINASTAQNDWEINGGSIIIEFGGTSTGRTAYFKSLTVNEGAFSMKMTGSQTNGLDVSGVVTVESDGSFDLEMEKATGTYVFETGGLIVNGGTIRVVSDHSTANYLVHSTENIMVNTGSTVQFISKNTGLGTALVYIEGSGRSMQIDDPKNLVLYSPDRRVLRYSTTQPWNMTANQFNLWNTAAYPVSGSLDGKPDHNWTMEDGSDLWINGTLASGANGNYTGITSNYNGAAGDPGTYVTMGMKVLSMGNLPLTVNEYYIMDSEITGTTDPGAQIRVTVGSQTFTAVADGQGDYQCAVSGLNGGETIVVESNKDFLYASDITEAKGGNLEFVSVPAALQFQDAMIPNCETVVDRAQTDWTIQIADNRAIRNDWKLTARLSEPLTPVTTEGYPGIDHAIIFVQDHLPKKYLDQTTPVPVYESSGGDTLINVQWAAGKGILAEFRPSVIFKDVVYKAEIEWVIQQAP